MKLEDKTSRKLTKTLNTSRLHRWENVGYFFCIQKSIIYVKKSPKYWIEDGSEKVHQTFPHRLDIDQIQKLGVYGKIQ